MEKQLHWWRKRLPDGVKHVLAKLWPVFLSVGTVSLFIGLYIAITGHVPGVSSNDPEQILSICWAFIFGGGLGMFLLSFAAGFAHDIQQQPEIGGGAYG